MLNHQGQSRGDQTESRGNYVSKTEVRGNSQSATMSQTMRSFRLCSREGSVGRIVPSSPKRPLPAGADANYAPRGESRSLRCLPGLALRLRTTLDPGRLPRPMNSQRPASYWISKSIKDANKNMKKDNADVPRHCESTYYVVFSMNCGRKNRPVGGRSESQGV